MLERLPVGKDSLVREGQEVDAVVFERKALVPLGQNGLDFLGVLVNGFAHHLYTEVVSALAVVSTI